MSRLVIFLLLLSAVAWARGDDAAQQHKMLVIPYVSKPLSVDATLADWPSDAPQAVMALDQDSDEFRGAARAAWDSQFFYVAFNVASGKPMSNAGDDPAMAYKTGDTVEVFLSVNDHPLENRLARGPGMDTAKEGDYRILLTRLRNTKPVVFAYDFVRTGTISPAYSVAISGPKARADSAEILPNAEMTVRPSTIAGIPGYVVEAKLPWAYFRGYHPKPNDRLLFDLAINFSNGAGTANIGKAYWNGPSHMTNDAGIEGQIHPENWGWLVLAAGK